LRPVTALAYGAVCHALFALDVGTMVAMMFFGMRRSLGTLYAPWSLIANAAMLAQFHFEIGGWAAPAWWPA
jgi:hypothetical protein